MLSNCRIIETDSDKLTLEFVGESMTNFSTLKLAEQSILCHDDKGLTILVAEPKCCLQTLLNGATLIEGNTFVAISYFDEPFVANIKLVNRNYIMFGFLNPYKSLFPEQYLRVTEIKSLHLINGVQYEMDQKGASDEN